MKLQKGGRHDTLGLEYQLIDAQLHLGRSPDIGRGTLARAVENELSALPPSSISPEPLESLRSEIEISIGVDRSPRSLVRVEDECRARTFEHDAMVAIGLSHYLHVSHAVRAGLCH